MVPSGSVCEYDDYFYDGHYDDRPDYFDYMIRVTRIVSLVCMAWLGQIIMSSFMICVARMDVGYTKCIVYLGAMPVWCYTEVEMRKVHL